MRSLQKTASGMNDGYFGLSVMDAISWTLGETVFPVAVTDRLAFTEGPGGIPQLPVAMRAIADLSCLLARQLGCVVSGSADGEDDALELTTAHPKLPDQISGLIAQASRQLARGVGSLRAACGALRHLMDDINVLPDHFSD